MQLRLPHWLAAALAACVLLPGAAPARVGLFTQDPGLSPEDNRLLFESITQLSAAEPVVAGNSEAWSNLQTSVTGTNTVLRVFRSDGRACHVVLHHIVSDGTTRDYRVIWCGKQPGEWKTYSVFSSLGEQR